MKFIVLLAISIFLAGCFSTIPTFDNCNFNKDQNLLKNGDFNQVNNNGLPSNWLIIGDKTIIVRVEENIGGERENSLFLSNLNSETDIVSDYFDVNPSEVFYCSLWLKSGGNSKGFIKLSIVAFDKNGKVVNTFPLEDFVAKKWKKFDLSTGFLSTSARYARVVITVPSGFKKSLWIDDIECFSAYKFMK